MNVVSRSWLRASRLRRAEFLAASWETFSVLLFSAAIFPRAYGSAWPGAAFALGLVGSALLCRLALSFGERGANLASAWRVPAWLATVLASSPVEDRRVLLATCGFGVMAFGMRRALYRRLVLRTEPSSNPRRLVSELSENAAVVGIAGGHLMLLFSVAFLRTTSEVVFLAWWQVIPALAATGTVAFSATVRPLVRPIVSALVAGPAGDSVALAKGHDCAKRVARELAAVNFVLWLVCIAVGIASIQSRPRPGWSDVLVPSAFGALFAWGVSFYQANWHDDTLRPVLATFALWRGGAESAARESLRRRMLAEFGRPLLFALTLSLFASIGMYRNLGVVASSREDFHAMTALVASFAMLVLAVGGLFVRAARDLSEPLRQIAKAADDVAHGKLDEARPILEGPREVHALSASIEDMRRALSRTIASLEAEREGLEANVARRTLELSGALAELKQAQAALVHRERMALLGQLVASVAHEIHNPLNAVSGSISALERVGEELRAMLDAYQAASMDLPEDVRTRLAAKARELDVDGAFEDLAGVSRVVTRATTRAVGIVSNLRGFARAAAEPVPTDLHVGLSETLLLLGPRFDGRGVIVETEFGELPRVTCVSGELNQVFMNLIANALDAIEQKPLRGGGRIRVATRHDGGFVFVRVSDDGPGVAPGLESKVFEPFVSTKPSGQGTGLGLSISREIMVRHGGELVLLPAEPGRDGASFECRLPCPDGFEGQVESGGRAVGQGTESTPFGDASSS